jgi:DNA-binding YbaB/EbfC family protein
MTNNKSQKFFDFVKNISKKMQELQEELASHEVEAEVGGGLVKVIANGAKEILKVTIDEELIESKDKQMIEELVKAGVNEALRKSQQLLIDVGKDLFQPPL